jgi:hypothetical protein
MWTMMYCARARPALFESPTKAQFVTVQSILMICPSCEFWAAPSTVPDAMPENDARASRVTKWDGAQWAVRELFDYLLSVHEATSG